MEWASAVALAAVMVTGVSVWTNRTDSKRRLDQEKELHRDQLEHEAGESEKRLVHEERMQTERLAHERIEAVRTTAAKAYSTSDSLLLHMTRDTVVTMGFEPIDGPELRVRKQVGEALDSLAVVSAMGWNDQVQDSALKLRHAITNLANAAWLFTKTIRQQPEVEVLDEIEARFTAARGAAVPALEEYRSAVGREIS